MGWRTGPIATEAWLLRQRTTEVGDAYVARTLRLSGRGGVAAFHFGAGERSEWHWRLGLLSMHRERDGDAVNTSPSGWLGLGRTTALTPRTKLPPALDPTSADGHEVSTSVLHLQSAGMRWRF